MQTTDHYSAANLAHICAAKGVKHAVISPGSRNAPLTIAFNKEAGIKCISIIDERSAAFFALGMSQYLHEPVALICTSGSAMLNYLPAAAEAFYQYIPLLFISADRPTEWIDQGIGQTIRQKGALEPHVKATIQLPQDPTHEDDKWYCQRLINEAMDLLTLGVRGPVHLNVPLREPLYGMAVFDKEQVKVIDQVVSETALPSSELQRLGAEFDAAEKVMILAGQHDPEEELEPLLTNLVQSHDVVVLTESTSNLDGGPFHGCIDRLLPATNKEVHCPDILISFGGPIISKQIIQLLQRWNPPIHWRIGKAPRHFDTFKSLSDDIDASAHAFFSQLLSVISKKSGTYVPSWQQLESGSYAIHQRFLREAPFCDLTAMEMIIEHVPEGSNIHWSNSTPIRYSQLFRRNNGHKHFSNRGTSGIDGCTSTAVGYAHASQEQTTLVSGDLSFLYDSNGLWNQYVPEKLKIIVISNGGGNIFKYIEGPDTTEELEKFFVTPSVTEPVEIAKAFGLHVLQCSDKDEMARGLKELYTYPGAAVLQVTTDPDLSPSVLRDYFIALTNG